MGLILFFLAGWPLVLLANRLAVRLTNFDDDHPESEDARQLPWHKGAWPDRVRWGVLLLLPPAMAVAAARFDPLQATAVSLLVMALLIIAVTDLLRFRVPNVITYPGTVLALALAVLMPDGSIGDAALAALLGGGVFLVMAILTGGGLGLGDVKLAVLIGAALGLPVAYQALIYGVFAGGIVIVGMWLAGVVTRKSPIPYAPFLSLSAIAVLLTQGAAFAPL